MSNTFRSRRTVLVVLVLLLIGLLMLPFPSSAVEAGKPSPLDSGLAATLASSSPTQQINVIVFLADEVDSKAISGKDRQEKQKNLIQALHKKSDDTQDVLRKLLQNRRNQGEVGSYTPLWIRNAIILKATARVINEVATYPEVGSIVADSTFSAPAKPIAQATTTATPVEPNISLINAPALWQLGYQGQGVVIASLDTGVDNTHPDLAASWRGGTNSWYDPYGQHPTTPTDMSGHGTWTMGVMVGGSAGGTSIGVAPQAKWIAAKIFNDSGTATNSAIHLAYQWILDPDGNPATADAPQIVNNSWSLIGTGCNLEFATDLANLVAAGITPVFAAGNNGPNSSSSSSPANNPNAFSVGSINNSNVIASDSSRGPGTCTGQTNFPNVVAPGVNIRTTDLYNLYYSASGTSLAAPHVTGGLALLLSAFPGLSVSQQESALSTTAVDLGTAGADYIYGSGRIDLQAAYNFLKSGATATPTATPIPTTVATATPTAIATSTPGATATPTSTPTPTVTPAAGGSIFSDSFESNSFSAWSSNTGGISVSASAALIGSYGMKATISGNTPGYVTTNSPNNETNYNARFYFNPNSTTTSSGQQDILVALTNTGSSVFKVQFRKNSGSYQVRGQVWQSGGNTTTSWYTITNASHAIEVGWQSSLGSSFSFYLDGTLKQSLNGLNTSAFKVKTVKLGPSAGLVSTASGIEYFDAFVSTRGRFIGL